VEGFKDLERAIDELTEDLARRVLRGSLRDAAQLIVRGARQRVPVLKKPDKRRVPGLIKRNIIVQNSKLAKRQGMVGVYVRVRRLTKGAIAAFKQATGRKGADNPFDPYYWWWLEFGTRKMRKYRYLSGAFEAARGQAVNIIVKSVGDRIAKANRRKP
jgi:HK97 gp10 family phage protein